jgi:sugar lactone lactonase YvrE
LYVADTSNARIAVLDTTTGTVGSTYAPNYDGGTQNKVTGATLTTLIDETSGLQKPAGLALHDDMLFVVDHATSTIWAFDLDGEVVDYLETGIAENSLMGIDFDSQGQLYVTNVVENQVIRISSL